jgi:cytochrome b561
MRSLAASGQTGEGAATGAAVPGYHPLIKFAHWTTLLLVIGLFATAWLADVASSAGRHDALVQVHRSLGLGVLGLTLFRLAWRWRSRAPCLPADSPRAQVVAARAVHGMLYVLLVSQPLIGLVYSNARGVRVSLLLVGELPALVGRDKFLARQALAAHETVALVLLALVALHTIAALYHHIVRRDGVLRTMLR